MMTVYVLICLSSILPGDCNRENAADVMIAEPAQFLGQCLQNGMGMAAELAAARGMEGYYAKILCQSSRSPNAA